MTTEQLIALLSAIAAILSAVMAWRSARSASSMLRLASADRAEKLDAMQLYLIDSVRWKTNRNEHIVSFAVSFINAATVANAVVRAELVVHASDSNGAMSEVLLGPTASDVPAAWDLKELLVPLNLEARCTRSGWISFRMPAHVSEKLAVHTYQLAAMTATGLRLSIESHVMRRLEDVRAT
jgi:hypothetical protein